MGITSEQKLEILKDRLNRLENSVKNIKCPGTVRKLHREVRNLEKALEKEAV